jgi:hypothetical protein
MLMIEPNRQIAKRWIEAAWIVVGMRVAYPLSIGPMYPVAHIVGAGQVNYPFCRPVREAMKSAEPTCGVFTWYMRFWSSITPDRR